MKRRPPALLLPRHICFTILGMMIFLGGCAAPERKIPDIVWPLPPDEPKVKFVDRIADTRELGWASGMVETIFGEEKATTFSKPYGVVVDSEERIYVTDIGKVWVLDMKKKAIGFIGAEPGPGQLRVPIGVAASADGRVLVADTAIDRVYVYRDGKFVGAIGKTGEFVGASGIAVDDARKLIYVVDAKKHIVGVYSLDNYQGLRTIGKRGTGDGEFNYPTNVAVDQQGRVYVVDTGNFRVEVFDENGKFLKSLGKLGDTPGSLARPKGIAIDSESNIYVVDAAFDNFQIFNYDGALLLYVGSGGVEPGKFLLPAGMAIDKDDKIYVVDQIPPSLQIFQFLGNKWKKSQEGQPSKP